MRPIKFRAMFNFIRKIFQNKPKTPADGASGEVGQIMITDGNGEIVYDSWKDKNTIKMTPSEAYDFYLKNIFKGDK